MKKILLILITLFLFNMNVKAASTCSYEEQVELNQKAANIKVSYEALEKKLEYIDGILIDRLFKVSIYNLQPEFYIIVKNNIDNEANTYYYSETSAGEISFEWDYMDEVTNFTFELYTTDETGCSGELYKTFYLTTPRYNEYSGREVCSDNPDFSLCQMYVTFEHISEESFEKQINAFTKKNNDEVVEELKNDNKGIIDFIKEYKWFFIGGASILVVIAIGSIVIFRIKTKKQRDLGL